MEHPMLTAYRSLKDIAIAFPDREACYDYLEKIRWKGRPVSPFEPEAKVTRVNTNTYKCKATNKRFNVLTGTVFAYSKLPLIDWFRVIWLLQARPGISTPKGAALCGMHQKTFYAMQQRLFSTGALRESPATKNDDES
jgi:hypothetical protein